MGEARRGTFDELPVSEPFAGLRRRCHDGRHETDEQHERHRRSLQEADHISSMSHRPRLSLRK